MGRDRRARKEKDGVRLRESQAFKTCGYCGAHVYVREGLLRCCLNESHVFFGGVWRIQQKPEEPIKILPLPPRPPIPPEVVAKYKEEWEQGKEAREKEYEAIEKGREARAKREELKAKIREALLPDLLKSGYCRKKVNAIVEEATAIAEAGGRIPSLPKPSPSLPPPLNGELF
jgi:hypothetical protein